MFKILHEVCIQKRNKTSADIFGSFCFTSTPGRNFLGCCAHKSDLWVNSLEAHHFIVFVLILSIDGVFAVLAIVAGV